MDGSYVEFLAAKRRVDTPTGIEVAEADLNPKLFPFQRDIVRWALRRGRAPSRQRLLLLSCGLGVQHAVGV